jgi:hypothetical protein
VLKNSYIIELKVKTNNCGETNLRTKYFSFIGKKTKFEIFMTNIVHLYQKRKIYFHKKIEKKKDLVFFYKQKKKKDFS